MKKITINQFHSIGDIIFILPIIKRFIQEGYEVLLPVRDHLMWIAEYTKHPEVFKRLSVAEKEGFVDHEFIKDDYVPLRFANQIINGYDLNDHHDFEKMMLDKYKLIKKHYKFEIDWKSIEIETDTLKGNKLLHSLELETKKGEYVFINNMSQAGKTNIKTEENFIEMTEISGYTLFDWYLVMVFSKEIHTVSTSILFVLQALHNAGWKLPHVYIYPRPNEDGLRGVQNLDFSYKYTLMQ